MENMNVHRGIMGNENIHELFMDVRMIQIHIHIKVHIKDKLHIIKIHQYIPIHAQIMDIW